MPIVSTSTSAFYDRSTMDIADLRKRAEGLQADLSRGQRISRSSDDPVGASRLRQLQRADSLSQIDVANAAKATADLQLTDGALGSLADYVIRLRELTTQAANGTMTAATRSASAPRSRRSATTSSSLPIRAMPQGTRCSAGNRPAMPTASTLPATPPTSGPPRPATCRSAMART